MLHLPLYFLAYNQFKHDNIDNIPNERFVMKLTRCICNQPITINQSQSINHNQPITINQYTQTHIDVSLVG